VFRLLQSGFGIAPVVGVVLLALACTTVTRGGSASLRRDAEVAEDLAIRNADVTNGVHSGHFVDMAQYSHVRDERMAEMFKTIARRHGVTEKQVSESLTYRPVGLDLLIMLSFAGLYIWTAEVVVRRIAHRSSMVITAYISIVLSGFGVLLGEGWTIFIEQVRLGTGHLSYRLDRIPWAHHRLALFIAGVVLYWFVRLNSQGARAGRHPYNQLSVTAPP